MRVRGAGVFESWAGGTPYQAPEEATNFGFQGTHLRR
jgi:hypothetical protein